MLFVPHFPRWLRENWATQMQIPVEYGLKGSAKPFIWYLPAPTVQFVFTRKWAGIYSNQSQGETTPLGKEFDLKCSVKCLLCN